MFLQITKGGINIHLRSHENGCTTVGLVNKTFCNGLEGEHTMNILSDELTDLINKEDKATAWCLLCKVCLDESHETVNIESVFAYLSSDIALCLCFADTFHLCKEFGEILFLQQDRWTVFNPLFAKAGFILRLQPFVLTFFCKVTFYLSNLRLLVIKAEFAVELFQEDIQHRVYLALSYAIKFLLYVEQYAFCRDPACFLDVTLQFKIITSLVCKDVCTLAAINHKFVFKNVREDFQQM